MFKTADQILVPDSRFHDYVVEREDGWWRLGLTDHHRMLEEIAITGSVPQAVVDAFDRARHVMLYAFFDYDLLVMGEIQAFGAFELALRHRLHGGAEGRTGTLRNLVDQARKAKIFGPAPPKDQLFSDPIEAMIMLRNGLAHGTSDVHAPGMALSVLDSCKRGIDAVFPLSATKTGDDHVDHHPG